MIAAHCPAAAEPPNITTSAEMPIAAPGGISASVYSGFQFLKTCKLCEGSGCFFQLVVAPEQLITDRDRRDTDHPQVDRLLRCVA